MSVNKLDTLEVSGTPEDIGFVMDKPMPIRFKNKYFSLQNFVKRRDHGRTAAIWKCLTRRYEVFSRIRFGSWRNGQMRTGRVRNTLGLELPWWSATVRWRNSGICETFSGRLHNPPLYCSKKFCCSNRPQWRRTTGTGWTLLLAQCQTGKRFKVFHFPLSRNASGLHVFRKFAWVGADDQ